MAHRKATPEETRARFGNGLILPGAKRQQSSAPSSSQQPPTSNPPGAFDLAAGEYYENLISEKYGPATAPQQPTQTASSESTTPPPSVES